MNIVWYSENLELFWHWIAERQKAFYRRKVKRAPPPWSSDPIIANNFFTNVYRELDPGTVWLRKHILNNTAYEDSERAFLCMAYRLFGTEEVFGALGVHYGEDIMRPGSFNQEELEYTLLDLMAAGKQAFTPAYMVSNYGDKRPKPVVIAEVLARAARTWPATWSLLRQAHDRKEAHAVLQSVYGIGRFVAFQTLVDLCYPYILSSKGVLNFSNDDWVAAGPGAQKGLQLLWPDFKLSGDNEAIAQLVRMQHHPLGEREMPWLVDERNKPIPVNRSNMQNCCCEFSKYMRLRQAKPGLHGGGRKRVFSSELALLRDRAEPTVTGAGGLAIQTDAFL